MELARHGRPGDRRGLACLPASHVPGIDGDACSRGHGFLALVCTRRGSLTGVGEIKEVRMDGQTHEVKGSGAVPDEEGLLRHVCVLDESGLHARPAARLAQEAQKFGADIRLVAGGQEVRNNFV